MKEKEIKVIIIEPMKEAYTATIKNELEELQKIVGGYIEPVTFNPEDNICLICNEEGKINGLPLNRALCHKNGEIWDIVAGTAFIVGDDYNTGNFISLTDEQIDKYLNQFLKPEMFYKENGNIKALKVEENFWEM